VRSGGDDVWLVAWPKRVPEAPHAALQTLTVELYHACFCFGLLSSNFWTGQIIEYLLHHHDWTKLSISCSLETATIPQGLITAASPVHVAYILLHTPPDSIATPNHQACSTAIESQVFLVVPLDHRHETTVTDDHLHNSNHHQDLHEDKTQEWLVMMTGSHKAMVLHHQVVSVCLQEDRQEAAEAAEALQDSCGPSRALEATPTPLVTCMFNQWAEDAYRLPRITNLKVSENFG
jgi:hypothetical protein